MLCTKSTADNEWTTTNTNAPEEAKRPATAWSSARLTEMKSEMDLITPHQANGGGDSVVQTDDI